MGDLATRLRKKEEAISSYEKALQLNPNLAEAHFDLGVLHDQQGNREEARRRYTKAVDISPATPKYRNNLAYLFFREGDYNEAIKQYGMNNRYPLSALEIGKVYWLTGKLEQARGQQFKAIQWLEDEAVATLPQNQGPWYFETGNEGVGLYDLAEKRCYAYHALSATLYLLGKDADAEARLKEARDLCPAQETDVRDVIRHDLERVTEANDDLRARTVSYRERFLAD